MKTRVIKAFLLGALCLSASAAGTTPVSFKPPEESAKLIPGPNVKTAEVNCNGCHSFDYITTQPHGASFGRDFWQAEVTKMIKMYGAPITEADAKTIVNYLASTYK